MKPHISHDRDGQIVINMTDDKTADTFTWSAATEPDAVAVRFITGLANELEKLEQDKVTLNAIVISLVHLFRQGETGAFDETVHRLTTQTGLFTEQMIDLLTELDSLEEGDYSVAPVGTVTSGTLMKDGEPFTIDWSDTDLRLD